MKSIIFDTFNYEENHGNFFKSGSGAEPVRDWILDLSIKDKRIVGFDIKTVEYGWTIGMSVCTPLGAS